MGSLQALVRYCCARGVVDDTSTREELTAVVERRIRWKGQPVRALHPFHPEDYALLQVVYRGEFNLTGFRNKDLQALLYAANPKTRPEQRRRSAAISRKLRLLRAHGLIRKRAHSHRYDLSSNGRIIISAILSAHRMTVQQINAAAA